MFFIIGVISSLAVANLISFLITNSLGDTQKARLFKVIFVPLSFITYVLLVNSTINSETVSLGMGSLIVFGPLGLLLLMAAMGYVASGK